MTITERHHCPLTGDTPDGADAHAILVAALREAEAAEEAARDAFILAKDRTATARLHMTAAGYGPWRAKIGDTP